MVNQTAQLDRTFHALADASRRAMLAQLARGPASVSALGRPLAMSMPAVMQHLAVLEGSGLVRSTKAGRVRTCRLEPEAIGAAEGWIRTHRALWAQRLDQLGTYLDAMGIAGATDVSDP